MKPEKKAIKVIVNADHFEVRDESGNLICIKLIEPITSAKPVKLLAIVGDSDETFMAEIGFGLLADAVKKVIKKQLKADRKAKK